MDTKEQIGIKAKSRKCARALITRADGKILLARRSPNNSLAGMWELAGGEVDEGESFEQALVREIHEELGLDIRITKYITEDSFLCKNVPMKTKIYLAVPIGNKGIVLNPLEHDRYGWFSLDKLATGKVTSSTVVAVNAYNPLQDMQPVMN